MKRFVLGDIHGKIKQLQDVLKKASFNYDEDELISLGDIVDRGEDSYACVEELLKIKNLISIRGNHDAEWLEFLKTEKSGLWSQGAKETYLSYVEKMIDPSIHFDFFNKQINYYIDKDNNLFIHGGFNRHKTLKEQEEFEYVFYWDRDLFAAALSFETMSDKTYPFKMKDSFNKIFIGHTPTVYWGKTTPIKAANIWNIDTGCGKGAYPLTLMNIETLEFYQA